MTQCIGILLFVIVTLCIMKTSSSDKTDDVLLFGSWNAMNTPLDNRNLSVKVSVIVLLSDILYLVMIVFYHAYYMHMTQQM